MRRPEPVEDDAFVHMAIGVVNLFKPWPRHLVDEIEKDMLVIRARPGDTIIQQGEVLLGLYAIATGRVEVGSINAEGRRYVRRIGVPGEMSGFLSVFDENGSPYSYRAQESTQILYLPKPAFFSLLHRHPDLWPRIAQDLVRSVRIMTVAVEEQIFESLRVRIARWLVSQAEDTGERQGTSVRVRITQDSLAALLGVTRQSVSKELKKLESEGLIRISYGHIDLPSRLALERVALARTGLVD